MYRVVLNDRVDRDSTRQCRHTWQGRISSAVTAAAKERHRGDAGSDLLPILHGHIHLVENM